MCDFFAPLLLPLQEWEQGIHCDPPANLVQHGYNKVGDFVGSFWGHV